MNNPIPPKKPAHLLDDLESIRELLGDENLEPPLLTDSLDPDTIPLLSDVVSPAPDFTAQVENAGTSTAPQPMPQPAPSEALRSTLAQAVSRNSSAELNRLDNELRAAAALILQDVIDDFVPQIEAELKRRLEARLLRLLPPRRS
ncbi:hypothetical protein FBY03_10890 [Pseudomonas sp. SJZ079]|uniref:DNA polymerase III subunit chi n=1 Tax=Pseudomonas sp. SJZ079 TaxID=2572887 RepID=UPI001199C9FE|nr:DNA polymerase III subunit chi [Pseudomonas sp. SJZ079]TWC37023.1 hypothetical protein FBY03_10890 [Pseudomonas sp. SJZ079]